MAYAAIISRGIRSCPMLKCSSDRCVCAPQSLSLGTSTSPRLSVSFRMSLFICSLLRKGRRQERPTQSHAEPKNVLCVAALNTFIGEALLARLGHAFLPLGAEH